MPRAEDVRCWNPLLWAVHGGDLVDVRQLLEEGAVADKMGTTLKPHDQGQRAVEVSPLMLAVQHGHELMVKLLLQWGANPEQVHLRQVFDEERDHLPMFDTVTTPLRWAQKHHMTSVLDMLQDTCT